VLRPFLTLILFVSLACGGGGGTTELDPPHAHSLLLVTAPSANTQNRSVLAQQPVVQVQDQHGIALSQAGILVNASVTEGGGNLSGTTTVATAANGQATFTNLVLSGTIGPRALSFSAPGLGSVSANVVLLAGTPNLVEMVTGDGQFVSAGSAVPIPPSVRIADADSNPVAGVAVVFSITSGGGSLQGGAATTDNEGVAEVGSWTLGMSEWMHTLSAAPEPDGIQGSPILFSAHGFPPWERVDVVGTQPTFATGVTYNRKRQKLTLVHPIYGIGEIDPEGGSWTQLEEVPHGAGRVYTAVHEATQRILMISDSEGPWYWDYATETWTPAEVGDVPTPRMFPAMVYDSINSRVLLYGGHITGGSSDPVADLSSWDGTSWTRLEDPPPGARGGHAMTYRFETGEIFMHGGTDLGNAFGGRAVRDTWVLDHEGDWTQLPVEHPDPMAIFPMAFDEERDALVVLGGTLVGPTGYGLSTRIWEMVDGEWHLSDESTPVGARALSTLVSSPFHGKLLLYGSEHAGWNDIWSYGF